MSSSGKISSSSNSGAKSGAWKGLVAGVGDAALERRVCPSTAENSEVGSMRGLFSVTGPRQGQARPDRARRSYSLVILA